MLNDFKFAVRSLRRRPGFAASVILTLALGIGSTSAVFSLLDASLLRALPFEEPDRLAMLSGVYGTQPDIRDRDIRGASPIEIRDWRALNQSFADVSAYDNFSLNLGAANEPRRVEAEMVSAGFFGILRVRAERGRTFAADEDQVPDAKPVAVVSHSLWTTQFGADPAIIGRAVTLNDRQFTVIGVMPKGFNGLSFDTEVWVPMAMISLTASPAALEARGNRWLGAIGRLRPGATMESAQGDLERVAARLTAAYPESNTNRSVRLQSLHEAALGSTRALLVALFVAVLLFLLIACANVVNLQLVRATSRRREMALRVAVGADRGRLFRQMLAEGLTLAAAGAVVGIALAVWGLGAFLPLVPDGVLPNFFTPSIDWRVLGFAAGLTIVCGVVFGITPAFRAHRIAVADSLKEGSRSAGSGITSLRRLGAQQVLVVSEVALALLLLFAGALMLRTLRTQLAVDPGFRADGVMSAQLSLPRDRYAPPERIRFVNALVERVASLPGVQSVAIGSDVPFSGGTNASTIFVDGVTETNVRHFRHRVTPDYFATFGIPLLRGRTFTAADRDSAPLVVVISEATARRFWPNQDAIGRRIRLTDATGPEATVIGIVGNARFRDLTTDLSAAASEPDVYYSFAQRSEVDLVLAVRTSASPTAVLAAVRRELSGVDAGLPLFNISPMTELLAQQTATGRFGSTVLASFSVVALMLASIGIYGVLAFVIGLSRREIAIRMALGATRGRVVGLIVRQGMSLVLAGTVLGVVGSIFAAGYLPPEIFGASAHYPETFTAVAVTLLVVAIAATYLPSRAAARIDPQLALKSD
jgi:predicted permease